VNWADLSDSGFPALLHRFLARPGPHTAAFYMALFMAMGVHAPFWPIWLEDWGLTAAEIGLYTALGVGVRMVAGLALPALADRLDARRATLVACALIAAGLFLSHLWIESRGVLLAATLGVGVTLAGIGPIGEALGVAAARHFGFAYARARGLGSIGFLGANLAVGALMVRTGSGIALWWIVACLLLTAALAVHHPGGRKVQGQTPPKLRELWRLMVDPVFAIFMLAVVFTQGSHAIFLAFGTIRWRTLGLGEGEIGALWAMSVAVEIVFLVLIGAWATRRAGPVGAMALGGAAGVLRWGVMMFDPTGWVLWPVQGLHALTFAAGHLGAIAFITQAIPARYGAAAQGATASMAVGVLLALGMLAGSAVYPLLGGLTYGIGVAFSTIGLGFCWWLRRRWRGEELAA
jgi:PPP family 3-phenylpropionic acid transporter